MRRLLFKKEVVILIDFECLTIPGILKLQNEIRNTQFEGMVNDGLNEVLQDCYGKVRRPKT